MIKPEWIVRGEVLDQFGALALLILRAGRTLGFSNVEHLASKKKTVVIKPVRDKNPRTPPR